MPTKISPEKPQGRVLARKIARDIESKRRQANDGKVYFTTAEPEPRF